MDNNSGVGGRTIAVFLLIMGISAAAAVPYFTSTGPSSVDDEESTAAAAAKLEEPTPETAKPAKTAPRAHRKSTPTRWSEGVTTSGSGNSTARTTPRPPTYFSQPTPRKQTYIEVQGYRDPNGGITF